MALEKAQVYQSLLQLNNFCGLHFPQALRFSISLIAWLVNLLLEAQKEQEIKLFRNQIEIASTKICLMKYYYDESITLPSPSPSIAKRNAKTTFKC